MPVMDDTHALAGPERPGPACVMVIFGAAGDLTKRKLLPALYNLRAHGLLGPEFAVIGVARKPMSHEAFREEQTRDVREFAPTEVDPATWAGLARALYYVPGEFGDPDTYARLAALLPEVTRAHGTGGNVLFYLATPPQFFGEVVRWLGATSLARERPGAWRRVVIEKPFGRDLQSARALSAELAQVLRESQVYRIDHYLGKETVQNIMVFRFANGLLEPIWNRNYVDHVQLKVAETVGVEGRGNYYDTAGVLRDMIQNHMFQLLAMVAMEPPISFQGDAVRDEKVKVLAAIRPMTDAEVLERTVRGQYGPGTLAGQRVPGYRQEPRVAPESTVETYAAVKLYVENWRWADVPFYLRSGKRLAKRDTEIVIQFRRPPLTLFERAPGAVVADIEPNRLVLHIQPDEGIEVQVKAKRPGAATRLQTVRLQFSYRDFGETPAATGYERLLYDVMVGDSTLFHRADMVEAAWQVASPILDAWAAHPPGDLPNYAAGSWGPAAADRLLERDGRRWIHDDGDGGPGGPGPERPP
jgi:glucose-6-phosphate 1-dehydrogenase